MNSAQVVETSVNVTSNSPSLDYTHPDDHNLRTYARDNSLHNLENVSIREPEVKYQSAAGTCYYGENERELGGWGGGGRRMGSF